RSRHGPGIPLSCGANRSSLVFCLEQDVMNPVGRFLYWAACCGFMSNAYFKTKMDWVRLSASSTMRKGGLPQPPSRYFSPSMSMISSRVVRNEKKCVGHRFESRYRESYRPA